MNGTDFRLFYERFAIFKLSEYLNKPPFLIKHLTPENPIALYDLEFEGAKYDVKCAVPTLISRKKNIPIWSFDLRKVKKGRRSGHGNNCDFFILIGIQKGIPQKVFLIPIKEAPTNHIRISINGVSKYNSYEI